MGYLGENNFFSFRDGFCEALPSAAVGTAEAAELGRTISKYFTRFGVGCCGFERLHLIYALSSGISECGKEVYVCENTELPSFRFGFPLLSADCGIFFGGSTDLKLSFFDSSGFTLPSDLLRKIMDSEPSKPADKSGRISSATSFRNIYVNNISDSLGKDRQPISAGISCGSRAVRSLWLEFFSGEDNELVFQISDDGQRVNAYSRELGFISHEKLILAYCLGLTDKGERVWLPETFHYGAERITEGDEKMIVRFDSGKGVPKEATNSRFLRDPLYMCTHLAKDSESLIDAVKRVPSISSAKRDITVSSAEKLPDSRTFDDKRGRVIITKSGKNRLTLLAQTFSSETAAELCADWTEKIRKAIDNRSF